MEIVVINFSLKGITPQDYYELCDQLAPAFAAVDGLLSKVWLADPDTNTFGGVYTFSSPADVDGFFASSLFADIAAHPAVDQPQVRRFQVMEEPTRVTRGLVPAGS